MARVLGLGCGQVGGSAEIALVEALRAAEVTGAEVEMVRLEELRLPSGSDPTEPDDAWWFWDRLLEADGVIVSAPIISRTVPARLKVLIDRLLGPNADRAIIEGLLAKQAAGEEVLVPFRVDERVIKSRVAAFIAVGGSLTPQWKTLTLPVMHTFTFSMQTAVVDQMVVSGAGTPRSIVLDDDALARASLLGDRVASQLGRAFDDVEFLGEPGLCPLCHLDIVELKGRAVSCAGCGASGRLADGGGIEWTDLDTSVISMAEKRDHYEEIVETATRHAKQRDLIEERATTYDFSDHLTRP
jgi:multimeric flavodoxin WrbA